MDTIRNALEIIAKIFAANFARLANRRAVVKTQQKMAKKQRRTRKLEKGNHEKVQLKSKSNARKSMSE